MPTLATREAARRVERYVAQGNAYNARERKADLQRAVNDTVRGLRLLADCKAGKDRMCDLVGYLIDEANNIDGKCLRDIDNAGETAEAVDLTEANDLWMKVRRG